MAGLSTIKQVTTRVTRRVPRPVRSALSQVWEVISRTVGICVRYRVTGLAAEAAFFAILSLPPLIFGLAGAVGYVAQRYDVADIAEFREQVLEMSSRALTPDAVETVIEPTLDQVLAGGRFEVISIGFVLALWSGSRALNVFVDTITIMYGLGGQARHRPDPGAVVRACTSSSWSSASSCCRWCWPGRVGGPAAAEPLRLPRHPVLAGGPGRHRRAS